MPNQEEFLDEDLDDEIDYDDGDYGFIISGDGELKHMMIPEDLMDDPPAEIKKILKIFGIKNIHMVDQRTLH
jgi:hypothetical protein